MPASTPVNRISIQQAFAGLHRRQQIAMMPFIVAGFGGLKTTQASIIALERAGATLLEIGFPFSDPIADGPVIQESFTDVLKAGVKVAEIFASIRQVRDSVGLPLVAMLSYSVVFRYGVERFVRDARASGFDGMIIPDLPPPEAEAVCQTIQAGGLKTILLVAPTSTPQRRAEIARLSSGFIYYLSVSGITGERDRLPQDLEAGVRQLKSTTEKPVCVGFGISKPEQLRQLRGVADGAIVGTAFVRRVRENLKRGPEGIASALEKYCKELLSLVR